MDGIKPRLQDITSDLRTSCQVNKITSFSLIKLKSIRVRAFILDVSQMRSIAVSQAGRPVGQPTTDDCQYNLLSVSAQPLRIGKICRQSSACEGVYRHPSGKTGGS